MNESTSALNSEVGRQGANGNLRVANRRQGSSVDGYSVRVGPRAQYVRLSIQTSGELVVVIPRGFARDRIPHIIAERREWIEKTRRQLEERRRTQPPPLLSLPSKIHLPAIGEVWSVAYEPSREHCATAIEQNGHVLSVQAPSGNPGLAVRVIRLWMEHRARSELVPTLEDLAESSGFSFSRLNVRSQKTRWGSCSTSGSLNLNVRLLLLPPELARHVLVHELCHTREMNHSARFWEIVRSIDPNTGEHRKRIRQAVALLPAWIAMGGP